ncbi:hypothetical protein J7L18_01690 [Candidatus Bathyarchaeota archaeon]|nr:hypothetical protein [Candidatus Bathyarchaeota archaeon]
MSGYDIITLILERLWVFLSAGSVYPMLHVMERKNLSGDTGMEEGKFIY